MRNIHNIILNLIGNGAKQFLKYTADKKKILKYHRAIFLSKGEFKNKNKLLKDPDENYGLTEPINDGMLEEEFQIKKNELFFINNSFGVFKKKKLELETQNQVNNKMVWRKKKTFKYVKWDLIHHVKNQFML